MTRTTSSFSNFSSALSALLLLLVIATPAVADDRIVIVEGQNYHLETLGKRGHTVVFEAGLGNDVSTWRLVARPIARFAHVVLYERPGLGKSLPMTSHSPVLAAQVAERLHKLLAAADLRPPYVLVGHSLGGLYVQMFAKTYPADVSGVVLLDSSSPDAPAELKTRSKLEPGTEAFLEQEGMAESYAQVKRAGAFPDIPLAVIAATDHGPYFKQWEPTLLRLQQQLATLSPKGALVIAEGSGHEIQIDRPQMVVDAVQRMVERKR